MMASQVFFWLLSTEDASALPSLLWGDDLGLSDANGAIMWLSPTAPAVSRGRGVLLLRYEGGGQVLRFCVQARPGMTPARVLELREALSPFGAARKWGPFIDRVGGGGHQAQPANVVQSAVLRGYPVLFRRPSHANPLIDLLMVRDRVSEAARLIATGTPIVGEVPQMPVEQKVGDRR